MINRSHRKLRRYCAVVLVLCSLPCAAAQYDWHDVPRIVAIGDVHGAYPQLIRLLQAAELIDDSLRWQGGQTHLVSLGDLLDRGPQSKQVMDLLMRLQDEAASAGGRVHVVLGNHELMNLTGDLRDVSDAEFAAIGGLEGHREAFAKSGVYGKWLSSLPAMVRINQTLFLHGGLSQLMHGATLDDVNRKAGKHLKILLKYGPGLIRNGTLSSPDLLNGILELDEETTATLRADLRRAAGSPLFGAAGPMWYRGTAGCHEVIEQPILEQALASLGAKRVVLAHTPTADHEITTRMNRRVFLADTGMLHSVYRGNPRGLEISGATVSAFGPDGPAPLLDLPGPDATPQLLAAEFRLQSSDDRGILLRSESPALEARFVKLSAREARRAEALYRLDRHLGLHMVPATVQRKIAGKGGVVLAASADLMSEQQRSANGRRKTNYCAQGSDYALLAAFDALSGMRSRNAANLWYQPPYLNIVVTDTHATFGTATQLPQYAQPPVLPAAFADRIAELNASELSALLGELIGAREITALLKRRDALLETWSRS